MQSTTTSSVIDPTHSNILLTPVLETEQKFSDAIKQKSFPDEKREIIYIRAADWLMLNGYLSKDSEWRSSMGSADVGNRVDSNTKYTHSTQANFVCGIAVDLRRFCGNQPAVMLRRKLQRCQIVEKVQVDNVLLGVEIATDDKRFVEIEVKW